jgi:hypothetical protein
MHRAEDSKKVPTGQENQDFIFRNLGSSEVQRTVDWETGGHGS